MRSCATFALIGLNVACWTATATAEEPTKGATDKPKITATGPRWVNTTYRIGVLSAGAGLAAAGNARSATAAAGNAASVATARALNALTVATVGNRAGVAGARTDTGSKAGGAGAVGNGGRVANASTGSGKIEPVAGGGSAQAAFAQPMSVTAAARNFAAAAGAQQPAQVAAAQPIPATAAAGNFAAAAGGQQLAPASPRSAGFAGAASGSGAAVVGSTAGAASVASWKTSAVQGLDSFSARATAVGDTAAVGDFAAPKLGDGAARAANVWNSTTSTSDPAQRMAPAGRKR